MITRVNSSFSASLELPELQLCELYEIELRTGPTYYYTSHAEDILWGGNTYVALPITRDPFTSGLNMEPETVRVYMGVVTGDLITFLENNNLEHATVTIKRIHYDTPTYDSMDELTIFQGTAEIEFNRNVLVLDLKPWIDGLNLTIPGETFQETCNFSVYDSYCGLKQSSFSYRGVAGTGSRTTIIDKTRGLVYKVHFDGGDSTDTIHKAETITGGTGAATAVCVNVVYDDATTGRLWYCELDGTQYVNDEVLLAGGGGQVTVNGPPEEVTTLYERGELRIRSGDNDGQRRPILSDRSYEIKTFWPFPNAVVNGDSYTIYPGCDGRADESCKSWFGNEENFSGFLYVPRIEETFP